MGWVDGVVDGVEWMGWVDGMDLNNYKSKARRCL